MNLKPLRNNIVLEAFEAEEKTSGGIIIPDTAKKKTMKGKVISVGDGSRDSDGKIITMEVKVGDIVMYEKWGGTEVTIGDKPFLIMKETDIIGIIKK